MQTNYDEYKCYKMILDEYMEDWDVMQWITGTLMKFIVPELDKKKVWMAILLMYHI